MWEEVTRTETQFLSRKLVKSKKKPCVAKAAPATSLPSRPRPGVLDRWMGGPSDLRGQSLPRGGSRNLATTHIPWHLTEGDAGMTGAGSQEPRGN